MKVRLLWCMYTSSGATLKGFQLLPEKESLIVLKNILGKNISNTCNRKTTLMKKTNSVTNILLGVNLSIIFSLIG